MHGQNHFKFVRLFIYLSLYKVREKSLCPNAARVLQCTEIGEVPYIQIAGEAGSKIVISGSLLPVRVDHFQIVVPQ